MGICDCAINCVLVLLIFEWLLKTGFAVCTCIIISAIKMTEAHQNENGGSSDTKMRNGSAETLKGPEDDSLSPEEKKLLRTVFISLVLDLLAFTVILPLLPSLLDYYGMKEVRY